MNTPAVIPFRWQRHGVDLCAIVTVDEVRWVMRDIALALCGDARDFAGEPGHDSQMLRDHSAATSWNLNVASRWIHRAFATGLTADAVALLQWLEDQEASLHRQGLGNAVRLASPREISTRQAYSVAEAAEILARDPAIDTGPYLLFDTLLHAGWTIRAGDTHRPTDDAIRLGWLELTHRRIPARSDLYPQVLVTAAGIRELHRLLGGQAAVNLDPPATTAALMEIS